MGGGGFERMQRMVLLNSSAGGRRGALSVNEIRFDLSACVETERVVRGDQKKKQSSTAWVDMKRPRRLETPIAGAA